MASSKKMLKKLVREVNDHDKLTEKLATAIARQNLIIGFIGVIGTVLMFTLGQLFPLFLKVLEKTTG